MTPLISQTIVGAQLALLFVTLVLSLLSQGRSTARLCAWVGSVFALCAVAIAVTTLTNLLAFTGTSQTYLIYAVVAVLIAIAQWVGMVVVDAAAVAARQRKLNSPKAATRAGIELREILRQEGMELDARLAQAEQEREEFLYALEERHAEQIAGLAKEYQSESQTILQQLLDQLAADELQPMVEQRLAAHKEDIERELGALDASSGGEALQSLRNELHTLMESVEAAEARVKAVREQNPDTDALDVVTQRIGEIEAQLDTRAAAVKDQLEASLASATTAAERKIADLAAGLDRKTDLAGNPVIQRIEAEREVAERRLATWLETVEKRFAETEAILNGRVADQESALESQVVGMEQRIEERLAAHVGQIEEVLAGHDGQLQEAIAAQGEAVLTQFAAERDRMVTDVTERANVLQKSIVDDLAEAEARARETVEATQVAWNQFTGELEERFAATRDEAMRAATAIAQGERDSLEEQLTAVVNETNADIAERVEQLGREAAWQRAQVERTVQESLDVLRETAQAGVDNADIIFADLERIGTERVERIRVQAEDALVQSRDYVEQLQQSLSQHLDALRERSEQIAEQMNDRLSNIGIAGQEAAQHLEQHARDVVDSVSHEIGAISEQHVNDIAQRLHDDVASAIHASLTDQQRDFERHVGELAQRIMQQVQGDLAGLAEHARGAVTDELEHVAAQAQDQARQIQREGYEQLMNDIGQRQREIEQQAGGAIDHTHKLVEDGIRASRRQIEEAMATMGGHLREELVRFQDEGRRQVEMIVEQLRQREHDMLREEDRKLAGARNELLRQHQGALEQQVRSMVGGLSGAVSGGSVGGNFAPGHTFTADVSRPMTPLADDRDAPTTSFGAPSSARLGSSATTNRSSKNPFAPGPFGS